MFGGCELNFDVLHIFNQIISERFHFDLISERF